MGQTLTRLSAAEHSLLTDNWLQMYRVPDVRVLHSMMYCRGTCWGAKVRGKYMVRVCLCHDSSGNCIEVFGMPERREEPLKSAATFQPHVDRHSSPSYSCIRATLLHCKTCWPICLHHIENSTRAAINVGSRGLAATLLSLRVLTVPIAFAAPKAAASRCI